MGKNAGKGEDTRGGRGDAGRNSGQHRSVRCARAAKHGGRHGPKRTWPPEIRLEVARLVVDEGQPPDVVAKSSGIPLMTIHGWIVKYQFGGEEALAAHPPGPPPEPRGEDDPVRQAVVGAKTEDPSAGARRVSDVLRRFEAVGVSPSTVRRILDEAGLAPDPVAHVDRGPKPPRRFERARPNQLWQTDLFMFQLRRHERVYLCTFMDDHSRFLLSHVLAHHQKASLVLETLERAIASWGTPEEVLSDQGRQYKTWRGETEFTQVLRQHGIRHVTSRPQHPQTLGKIERFWKTLWDEFLSRTVFSDFDDCVKRLALFVDGYNFQRPHQALEGLTSADRFFRSAPLVRAAVEKNVAANAMLVAKKLPQRKPFYLVGRLGDRDLSIAANGDRLRVQVGDEPPQSIPLPKENADEAKQADRAAQAPGSPREDAGAARPEVAEELDGPRRDRPAPVPAGALDPRGGAPGHRGDHADADLPRDVLPARDAGAERDAAGADAGGGRGREQRLPDRADRDPRGEGEAARAGEAPRGAPVALHPEALAGAGEGGAGPAGGQAEQEAEDVDLGLDDGGAEDRERPAFDPDDGWRNRILTWEKKLASGDAPIEASTPEVGAHDRGRAAAAPCAGRAGDGRGDLDGGARPPAGDDQAVGGRAGEPGDPGHHGGSGREAPGPQAGA